MQSIDVNLIYCLPPLVLVLIIAERRFKAGVESKMVLKIVRWTILAYTAISIFQLAITYSQSPETVLERMSGDNGKEYLVLLCLSLLLPLTLLNSKLASRNLYILFVAIFMKFGWYFERIVILFTYSHRDYMPDSSSLSNAGLKPIALIVFQGIILGLIALLIAGLLKRKNT